MHDATRPPSRPGFGPFLALFVVLTILSAVPLLLTAIPPLLDYPNHLARMHLLPRLPSPDLARFYAVAWAPLPNLAMDAVVPFLAMLVPLLWAGKLFILITFMLLAGGTAALHRTLFGAWSPWPALAFLLLYTRLLLWGFLGYLFGCGLALFAFTAWIASSRCHWSVRLLLGCVFALAIYLAHLLAFAIYAVMIAAYEFGAIWRLRLSFPDALRRLVIGGVPFLPALALMSLNSAVGRIIYGNPLRKLDLLFSVFDNYSRPFDVACFALAAIALALAFQRRWVKLAPEMAGPLIGLVVLYLALPTELFTAAGADRRIPMMIFLVLIGASRWVAPSRAAERVFLGAAALLFAVRLGVIAASWLSSGRVYAEILPGIDSIPVGSCVAAAFDREGVNVQKTPLAHFPTIAVARRDAFVPTLFAYPTQQPIRLQPSARALADALSADDLWNAFVAGSPPLPARTKAALGQCDYIAFAGSKAFALADRAGLDPAFITPRFQLYRIVHPFPPGS
jgi:hypothetical protein